MKCCAGCACIKEMKNAAEYQPDPVANSVGDTPVSARWLVLL